MTKGYPCYLQEWGHQARNAAARSPISVDCIAAAEKEALRRLDEGFFAVRIGRLTPREKEWVIAMERPEAGRYRSSDVADVLGEKVTASRPRRAQIIAGGDDIRPRAWRHRFYLPMFDEYLDRRWSINWPLHGAGPGPGSRRSRAITQSINADELIHFGDPSSHAILRPEPGCRRMLS